MKSTPAKLGHSVTKANEISAEELEYLKNTGHAVMVYPRKGIVCVDGFKRYKLPVGYKP